MPESPRAEERTESSPIGSAQTDTVSVVPPMAPTQPAITKPAPKEIGGRGGLDPTRYGDWEKDGRCIDF